MYLLRTCLLAASLLLLASCASLPSGIHRFSLDARQPDHATWKLGPLNKTADMRLAIDMPAGDNPANIAALNISFQSAGEFHPYATLAVSDPRCAGFYSVVFSYRSKPSEFESVPLKLGIPWDKQMIVSVRWRGSDSVVVTVNDNDPIEVPVLGNISEIEVEATRGRIDNAVLDYQVVEKQ